MLSNIIASFIAIGIIVVIGLTAIPMINDSIETASMNISSNPTAISGDLLTFLHYVPYIFGAMMILMVVFMIAKIFSDSGGLGSENIDYIPSESSNSNSEDEEDEEDEIEVAVKKRSTIITTRKSGEVKRINVKPSKTGYNVDKYELDKPEETKLSVTESTFSKTKFD